MKKCTIALACLLLLSPGFAEGASFRSKSAVPAVKIFINGRELLDEKTSPVLSEDRTYLPLRAVSEALGYTVTWDQGERRVTLARGEDTVAMTIGEKTYRHNDEEKIMDVAPYIEDDRTWVPIRYLGEATNLPVAWMNEERIVTVGTYPKKEVEPKERIEVEALDLSFALPEGENIAYSVSGDEVRFFEKNNEAHGDGYLFSLSRVKNPRDSWNNHPVILDYRDGLYYGADFRGDPVEFETEALKADFEKAYDLIDDILMTVRVEK